jgi:hypothetical protein
MELELKIANLKLFYTKKPGFKNLASLIKINTPDFGTF